MAILIPTPTPQNKRKTLGETKQTKVLWCIKIIGSVKKQVLH